MTIGLPVYNGGAQIEVALDSILKQTYPNIQVVISDNASTDDTREVCEHFCAQDPRFHYFRQPVNTGPTSNFQVVLDRAEGEFFMWLGHDDWLSENYIEECAKALFENPDVSLACGQAVYHENGEERRHGVPMQLSQERPSERVSTYYDMVTDNGTFYGLMRREQLIQVKSHNVMGADWLTIASMAFMGKVMTLPTISVNRTVGGSSGSYERIARVLGLPRFQALFPHVAIAYFAFKDIIWSDPLYGRSLKGFQRLRLAWKCQRSIRLRHGASAWDVFRKTLSLCKQRWKSLIGRDCNELDDPTEPGT